MEEELDKNKNQLIQNTLYQYYDRSDKIHHILNITQQKSKLSLRLLDWLCTNYAKKNTLIVHPASGSSLNLYLSYKTQLKAYSKKQFDPFCRRSRIQFIVKDSKENDVEIETTIGQLNFFKWALSNGVISYALSHTTQIEEDMNMCLHNRKLTSKPSVSLSKVHKPKKNETKKIIYSKTFTKTHSKVTIQFQ